MRESKYGNTKTTVDNITFDSKKESETYRDLCLLQRAGEISGLQLQVRFPMMVNGIKVCDYIADFVYETYGQKVVMDTKGVRTDVYRLKKKLMLACHGITITEV